MDTKRIGRREAIGMMGAAGAAIALGCGSSPAAPSTTVQAAGAAAGGSTNAACAVTPAETAGPFPSLTHLFRSDIRDGKPGTLLNLGIKVVNTHAGCAPVSDANVEIWHVDAAGNYSEHGSQTTQNFLRGIQTTNGSGDVSFTTIFPGWYQGRATHIHIEVTIGGTSRKVTQIAFPESVNNTVYRLRRLRRTRNEPDGQCIGRNLRRQSLVRAGHSDRGPGSRVYRKRAGGDCAVASAGSLPATGGRARGVLGTASSPAEA